MDHRPHRPVEHENPLAEQLIEGCRSFASILNRHAVHSVRNPLPSNDFQSLPTAI